MAETPQVWFYGCMQNYVHSQDTMVNYKCTKRYFNIRIRIFLYCLFFSRRHYNEGFTSTNIADQVTNPSIIKNASLETADDERVTMHLTYVTYREWLLWFWIILSFNNGQFHLPGSIVFWFAVQVLEKKSIKIRSMILSEIHHFSTANIRHRSHLQS